MDAVAGMSPRRRAIQVYADVVTLNGVIGCADLPQPYAKVAIAAEQVALT